MTSTRSWRLVQLAMDRKHCVTCRKASPQNRMAILPPTHRKPGPVAAHLVKLCVQWKQLFSGRLLPY
eukprot:674430-Amphidinium_carterae.1